MEKIVEDIAAAHRAMIDKRRRPGTYSGKVKSVDTNKKTAMVALSHYDPDTDMKVEVLLNATKSSSEGFIVYPAVDSDVIVADVDGDGVYTVVRYGKITRVDIGQGIDILINNGDNAGIVKAKELKTKLNNLENAVNQLKNILTTWVPIPNDGGAALKTAAASWAGQTLTLTQDSDLQNQKVKH